MALRHVALDELEVADEASFRHVELYADLKRRLLDDGVRFAIVEPHSHIDHHGAVSLLNLAFWRPDDVAEIFVDRWVSADQLAHCCWHHVAARALGAEARTVEGLLLAEAIASAFDVYLVGRLLGHAPDSSFLETQVPAMADAARMAGMGEDAFEAMLQRWSREPEECFERLRALLFDTSIALTGSGNASDAAGVLERAAAHELGPLLYHYELPTWVLYARAYGERGDATETRLVDRTLAESGDALAWLRERWVNDAATSGCADAPAPASEAR